MKAVGMKFWTGLQAWCVFGPCPFSDPDSRCDLVAETPLADILGVVQCLTA